MTKKHSSLKNNSKKSTGNLPKKSPAGAIEQISKTKEGKTSDSLHDRFFKRFYSEPEFAIDIFKLTLSKEEFNALRFQNLKNRKRLLKRKKGRLSIYSLT